jgi:tetratricopeptide (TPR) repeat protein
LLARLERRLPMLIGGPRDLPARLQTLRSTIDWSYDLLSPDEQRLLRELAGFVGGWSLEAAEGVSTAGRDTLGLLESLVAHSLARREPRDDGETRFTMLETIREYALDRLESAGEGVGLHHRHAVWFLAWAEEANPNRTAGSRQQDVWLDAFERERDNLRAALRWFREANDVEQALRLGNALSPFWFIRGPYAEGGAWQDVLLALPNADKYPALVAVMLVEASKQAHWNGDLSTARQRAGQALALQGPTGDDWCIGVSLNVLGRVERDEGNYPRAIALLEEALVICRRVGLGEESTLQELGIALREQGEPARAQELLEESLRVIRATNGSDWMIGFVIHNLGLTAEDLGDDAQALTLYREALTPSEGSEFQVKIAMALDGCASLAAKAGQPRRALRLVGAAARILEEAGIRVPLMIRGRVEQTTQLARSQLGSAAVAAEAAGRAMSRQEAIALALGDTND